MRTSQQVVGHEAFIAPAHPAIKFEPFEVIEGTEVLSTQQPATPASRSSPMSQSSRPDSASTMNSADSLDAECEYQTPCETGEVPMLEQALAAEWRPAHSSDESQLQFATAVQQQQQQQQSAAVADFVDVLDDKEFNQFVNQIDLGDCYWPDDPARGLSAPVPMVPVPMAPTALASLSPNIQAVPAPHANLSLFDLVSGQC